MNLLLDTKKAPFNQAYCKILTYAAVSKHPSCFLSDAVQKKRPLNDFRNMEEDGTGTMFDKDAASKERAFILQY